MRLVNFTNTLTEDAEKQGKFDLNLLLEMRMQD
jgi:hypothetical protein